MSYFDEWVRDYFTKDEEDAIRSIGCWSYGSSVKRLPQEVRNELGELGVKQESINQFIEGVFGKLISEYGNG